MRILYGVQGPGNGHISRCRSVAEALARKGVEVDYLPEIGKTDFQGVTAKIQFDEKGDLKGGAISLYQVKDGKWEYRETVGGAAPAAEAPKAEGEKK